MSTKRCKVDAQVHVVVLGTVPFGGAGKLLDDPFKIPVPAGPMDTNVADFNHDGLLDVAVLSRGASRITIALGSGGDPPFVSGPSIGVSPSGLVRG